METTKDTFLEDLHRIPLEKIDLATLEPVRANVAPMSHAMVQAVADGAIKPEELIVKLKFLEEVFSSAHDLLVEQVRRQAELNNGTMQTLGAKIEACEVATRYDYSNDVIWHRLYAKMQEEAAKVKEREKFLKAVSKSMDIVDEETGEVIKVTPPGKNFNKFNSHNTRQMNLNFK